jgi:ABC-type lipoprotein export system ATPase subunit
MISTCDDIPTQTKNNDIKYLHALKDINTSIEKGKFVMIIG